MTDLTSDTFFKGRISIKQPASGYRFSIDAVILGNLAEVNEGDRVLDIGTGCGVIPIILRCRQPGLGHVFGAEIQQELAQAASQNAADNLMNDHITILHKDIRSITPKDTSGRVDAVVCNPPHFAEKTGRINPDSQRAMARHEIAMTLSDLASAASRMLPAGGKLATIYPCERVADLITVMRNYGIEPKKLRMIHPCPETSAMRVLAHCIKSKPTGMNIDPPLYIRSSAGDYSAETSAMFSP
ncbi:MAG: tRNA1(Val) (adenine(37)-N6)-methyltransferase [Thermodesulfobacteriota bacterium]